MKWFHSVKSESIDPDVVRARYGFFHNCSRLISRSDVHKCAGMCKICCRFLNGSAFCLQRRSAAASVRGGGHRREAGLMQSSPRPESRSSSSPFRCDRCCWLLGDNIPGTKRAQLVWTGPSETTSCSGRREPTINASLWCLKKRPCHVCYRDKFPL